MPTNLVIGSVAETVGEQFLELVCADEDLLRAEFDAIIASEWPTPPADDRAAGGVAAHHPRFAEVRRGATCVTALATRPHRPGVGGWARPRSPPHA